jgi:hypothetical protein
MQYRMMGVQSPESKRVTQSLSVPASTCATPKVRSIDVGICTELGAKTSPCFFFEAGLEYDADMHRPLCNLAFGH